jgi:hypothetical protein
MSATQTTPAPAEPTTDRTDRSSLVRWIGGGTAVVAGLAAVAIAVWPASATDKARADGEQVGEAIAALYDADSTTEVDAALADLDAAVAETRAGAGDAVADQAADQQDALATAAEGVTGTLTADDEFEADLYQAELDYAIDDLTDNASDFRAEGPQVNQAFWEGVEDGIDS